MTLFDALVRLAAELPDPGAPMFPGISAGYGAFAAGVVAWLGRRPVGPFATGGSIVGFGIGFLCWVAALAIDRL